MIDLPIVVFVADDMEDPRQADDFGFAPQEISPNVVRFRNENFEFKNAHCPAPSCHPARVSMWSGVPPLESGILRSTVESTYASSNVPLPWIQNLFWAWGWRVRGAGKVFHKFQQPGGDPQPDVFRDGYIPEYPPATPHGGGYPGLPYGPSRNRQADERLIDEIIDDLAALDLRDIYFVGCKFPHSPLAAPQRCFDRFPLSRIVIPKAIPKPNGLASQMLMGQSLLETIKSDGAQKDVIQAYLASTYFADEQFGRVLGAVPPGTRIVFVSDQGWSPGERGGMLKGQLWNRVTLVPFAVKAPALYTPISESRLPISTTRMRDLLAGLRNGNALVQTQADTALIVFETNHVQGRTVVRNDLTAVAHWRNDNPTHVEYELYRHNDTRQQWNLLDSWDDQLEELMQSHIPPGI